MAKEVGLGWGSLNLASLLLHSKRSPPPQLLPLTEVDSCPRPGKKQSPLFQDPIPIWVGI